MASISVLSIVSCKWEPCAKRIAVVVHRLNTRWQQDNNTGVSHSLSIVFCCRFIISWSGFDTACGGMCSLFKGTHAFSHCDTTFRVTLETEKYGVEQRQMFSLPQMPGQVQRVCSVSWWTWGGNRHGHRCRYVSKHTFSLWAFTKVSLCCLQITWALGCGRGPGLSSDVMEESLQ